MDQEEFNKAFQFGVDTGGAGIRNPAMFGCETEREVKEDLAELCSEPLLNETHVYRIRASFSRLVGINARSKEHADRKLERQLSPSQLCEEYVGELNDLLDDICQEEER